MANRIDDDLAVGGTLTAKLITLPTGSVADTHVVAAANVAATKLEHQHQPVYAQVSTATAAAATQVLHVARGASGTAVDFSAGTVVACTGNATITLDLKKNGATILPAPIVLDNANLARVVETLAIVSGALVAGDVLEVVVTVNVGTGVLGVGLFTTARIREKAD